MIFFSNPVLICSERDHVVFIGEQHIYDLSDKAEVLLGGAPKCFFD